MVVWWLWLPGAPGLELGNASPTSVGVGWRSFLLLGGTRNHMRALDCVGNPDWGCDSAFGKEVGGETLRCDRRGRTKRLGGSPHWMTWRAEFGLV